MLRWKRLQQADVFRKESPILRGMNILFFMMCVFWSVTAWSKDIEHTCFMAEDLPYTFHCPYAEDNVCHPPWKWQYIDSTTDPTVYKCNTSSCQQSPLGVLKANGPEGSTLTIPPGLISRSATAHYDFRRGQLVCTNCNFTISCKGEIYKDAENVDCSIEKDEGEPDGEPRGFHLSCTGEKAFPQDVDCQYEMSVNGAEYRGVGGAPQITTRRVYENHVPYFSVECKRAVRIEELAFGTLRFQGRLVYSKMPPDQWTATWYDFAEEITLEPPPPEGVPTVRVGQSVFHGIDETNIYYHDPSDGINVTVTIVCESLESNIFIKGTLITCSLDNGTAQGQDSLVFNADTLAVFPDMADCDCQVLTVFEGNHGDGVAHLVTYWRMTLGGTPVGLLEPVFMEFAINDSGDDAKEVHEGKNESYNSSDVPSAKKDSGNSATLLIIGAIAMVAVPPAIYVALARKSAHGDLTDLNNSVDLSNKRYSSPPPQIEEVREEEESGIKYNPHGLYTVFEPITIGGETML